MVKVIDVIIKPTNSVANLQNYWRNALKSDTPLGHLVMTPTKCIIRLKEEEEESTMYFIGKEFKKEFREKIENEYKGVTIKIKKHGLFVQS